MSAKPKKIQKESTKPVPAKISSPRRLQESRYKSFRLTKRIRHPTRLLGSFRLLGKSFRLLRTHWRVLSGIVLIYGLLNIALVRGLGSGLDVQELKDIFQESELDQLSSGLTIFTLLLGTNTNAEDPTTSTYQSMIVILVSLALIWAVRQMLADKRIGVRDAFYKGMYPLIPFILVLFVMGLQLLPMVVGSGLFASATVAGSVITSVEKIIFGILFFLLVLLSLYMLCSSIFALIIVTLPDMTPLKALRSARQLVKHRRFAVLRRILFLPLALMVLSIVVILPLILFAAPLAEPVFFVYSAFALALIHSYLYLLYRELL